MHFLKNNGSFLPHIQVVIKKDKCGQMGKHYMCPEKMYSYKLKLGSKMKQSGGRKEEYK